MNITEEDLVAMVNNPSRAINTIVDELENSWFNGEVKINSASHPAIFCMDVIVGTNYGYINELQDAVSNTFAKHARTLTELSKNMADGERQGLFGTPSQLDLAFVINTDVLKKLAKAVYDKTTGNINYYKLLIPKDTMVTISGFTFCLENGVELRYDERTGYQAVYDSSNISPFKELSSNILEKYTQKISGNEYLVVTIPVRQLKCVSLENQSSTAGSGCKGTMAYEDYFYGLRAFFTQNGVKKEITITYDREVFDSSDLTLTLNVDTVNKTISYAIPDVYISNGKGVGNLDIYLYTTKGELVKDLRNEDFKEYSINYLDYTYGSGTLGTYSEELRNTGGVVWKVESKLTGGSNPKTFTDIKEAVINGRYSRQQPIREGQLTSVLEGYDYGVVKAVDNLTNRNYSITKDLPVNTDAGYYSPMGVYVGSYLTSISNLVSSGLVYNNSSRVTLPSDTLFNITTEESTLVGKSVMDQYNSYTSDGKLSLLENNSLVSLPFYYVFDTTDDTVRMRTYHLDEPKLTNQVFLNEDPSLGFEVGVGGITVTKEDSNYIIIIETKSGDAYKELDNDSVGVQLSFNAVGGSKSANIAAELVSVGTDGERFFKVTLESNLDIDKNDVIYFTNLTQYGSVRESTGVNLEDQMTIFFTMATNKSNNNDIDQTLFDTTMSAITESSYTVSFGKRLETLYSRIRPISGGLQYQTYQANIPETYEKDVYEYSNGELVYENGLPKLLHKTGDIVYVDAEKTQPLIKHQMGNFVRDEEGNPVLLGAKELMYHFDYIGFDATYYFANDSYDKAFLNDTKAYFVEVIDKDLEYFNSITLDNTTISYQPKNNMGLGSVIINDNSRVTLRQDLSFSITYFLDDVGMKNQVLKENLLTNTPIKINELLIGATTFDASELVSILKPTETNSNIKSIKVEAYSGSNKINVISAINELRGFSVRKGLDSQVGGLLSVKEAISISFLTHDASLI